MCVCMYESGHDEGQWFVQQTGNYFADGISFLNYTNSFATWGKSPMSALCLYQKRGKSHIKNNNKSVCVWPQIPELSIAVL